MKKEEIIKALANMEEYTPISKIENELKMPKTTLQKTLSGNRVLPKKWNKILNEYLSKSKKIVKEELVFSHTPTKNKDERNKLESKIEYSKSTPESYDALPSSFLTQDEVGQWGKPILSYSLNLPENLEEKGVFENILEIQEQIEKIKAEKIPLERNTPIGRKVWDNDQKKRIDELQKQLK